MYRRTAFEAHGRECTNCDAVDELEVHHRDGDRTNNDPENLLPLCTDCHSAVHSGSLSELADELLPVEERPQIDPETTSYQFEVDKSLWSDWKNSVPRTKPLDQRIRELIKADREGRIRDADADTE